MHGLTLAVCATHDLHLQIGGYLVLHLQHAGSHVCLQLGFQRIKLGLCVLVIPLQSGCGLQQVQHIQRTSVCRETAILDIIGKIFVVSVTQTELAYGSHLWMAVHVAGHPIEHLVGIGYIEHERGQRVGLGPHVGFVAATVAHLPSATGVEHVGQAVGHRAHRPVGVQVAVVVGLYAASAGDIIATDGQL